MRRKPWQYGLASLFWLTTAVALVVWLDVPYWLHVGGVFVQILIALAGVSLVGGLIIAPFALFAGLRWILEEFDLELFVDRLRKIQWRPARRRLPTRRAPASPPDED